MEKHGGLKLDSGTAFRGFVWSVFKKCPRHCWLSFLLLACFFGVANGGSAKRLGAWIRLYLLLDLFNALLRIFFVSVIFLWAGWTDRLDWRLDG